MSGLPKSTVPDLGKPEASETYFEAPSRILLIDTGASTHMPECLRKKQAESLYSPGQLAVFWGAEAFVLLSSRKACVL